MEMQLLTLMDPVRLVSHTGQTIEPIDTQVLMLSGDSRVPCVITGLDASHVVEWSFGGKVFWESEGRNSTDARCVLIFLHSPLNEHSQVRCS